VAAAKIHFEEQALVARTKQGMQADKAVGPACFVLCLLLVLARTNGSFHQINTLSNLIFLDVHDSNPQT